MYSLKRICLGSWQADWGANWKDLLVCPRFFLLFWPTYLPPSHPSTPPSPSPYQLWLLSLLSPPPSWLPSPSPSQVTVAVTKTVTLALNVAIAVKAAKNDGGQTLKASTVTTTTTKTPPPHPSSALTCAWSRRCRVGFDDVDAKHPNTGVSVGEDIKNNASIRGKSFGGRWRGDRRIAAAAARMRRWRRRAKGKGMIAPNQHRRGKGRMTMVSREE